MGDPIPLSPQGSPTKPGPQESQLITKLLNLVREAHPQADNRLLDALFEARLRIYYSELATTLLGKSDERTTQDPVLAYLEELRREQQESGGSLAQTKLADRR